MPSIIALIPARSGSKRIPDKNIKILAGHPLIAYTIVAAKESSVFDKIIVSTDSEEYAKIAIKYGAEVPFLRPFDFAGDTSPDIEWIKYTLEQSLNMNNEYDCFSILRPTSPFRLPETIQRAWKRFTSNKGVDSLRAVELCAQHPGKMWVIRGERLLPLLPIGPENLPWHSSQYPSLPKVYVQNASLEIAWSRIVFSEGTIAGNTIVPFLTKDYEGFDLNSQYDWELAQHLVESGKACLPELD